jgi:hypothetical protein
MKSSAAETLPVKSPPFIRQRLERNENNRSLYAVIYR